LERDLKNILIIGGARCGKSRLAQELALKSGEAVLFVATAEAGDEEMRQRIEAHQRSRPDTWRTLEATTHIGIQLTNQIGEAKIVVVDCITLLINNIFNEHSHQTDEQIDAPLIEKEASTEISELVECINQVDASFIIVTNEVGTGLVPVSKTARLYRDLLGKANQILAEHADEVYLMVAGLPVPIKSAKL